jgi:hypothetical protein
MLLEKVSIHTEILFVHCYKFFLYYYLFFYCVCWKFMIIFKKFQQNISFIYTIHPVYGKKKLNWWSVFIFEAYFPFLIPFFSWKTNSPFFSFFLVFLWLNCAISSEKSHYFISSEKSHYFFQFTIQPLLR